MLFYLVLRNVAEINMYLNLRNVENAIIISGYYHDHLFMLSKLALPSGYRSWQVIHSKCLVCNSGMPWGRSSMAKRSMVSGNHLLVLPAIHSHI